MWFKNAGPGGGSLGLGFSPCTSVSVSSSLKWE